MTEKTHSGMSNSKLLSALPSVLGLCANHHLLQIETSLMRVERMNMTDKSLRVSLILFLASVFMSQFAVATSAQLRSDT